MKPRQRPSKSHNRPSTVATAAEYYAQFMANGRAGDNLNRLRRYQRMLAREVAIAQA